MAVPNSENEDFWRWTLGAIVLSVAVRLLWNGTASPPPLPEEAKHWIASRDWAWGYDHAQPLSACSSASRRPCSAMGFSVCGSWRRYVMA